MEYKIYESTSESNPKFSGIFSSLVGRHPLPPSSALLREPLTVITIYTTIQLWCIIKKNQGMLEMPDSSRYRNLSPWDGVTGCPPWREVGTSSLDQPMTARFSNLKRIRGQKDEASQKLQPFNFWNNLTRPDLNLTWRANSSMIPPPPICDL